MSFLHKQIALATVSKKNLKSAADNKLCLWRHNYHLMNKFNC